MSVSLLRDLTSISYSEHFSSHFYNAEKAFDFVSLINELNSPTLICVYGFNPLQIVVSYYLIAGTVTEKELPRWFVLSSWCKLVTVPVGTSVGHFLD